MSLFLQNLTSTQCSYLKSIQIIESHVDCTEQFPKSPMMDMHFSSKQDFPNLSEIQLCGDFIARSHDTLSANYVKHHVFADIAGIERFAELKRLSLKVVPLSVNFQFLPGCVIDDLVRNQLRAMVLELEGKRDEMLRRAKEEIASEEGETER